MLVRNSQGDIPSVPYFQKAVELDPTFAMAYNRLGVVYFDSMQFDAANQMFRKAFDLREGVSPHERFYIESRYYHFVTADMEKALAVYEAWQHEFPHDTAPCTGAGMIHNASGNYEKALQDFQNALQKSPDLAYNYTNLAEVPMSLDRRADARLVLSQMQSRKLEEVDQYLVAYQLAFLDGDTSEMQKQLAASAGKPLATEFLLLFQSQAAAGRGRIHEARQLLHEAVNLALSLHDKSRAAIWQAQSALFEAEIGNQSEAVSKAQAALRLFEGGRVRVFTALSLARTGQISRAREMASQLKREHPDDTILLNYWLPCIDAAVDLNGDMPDHALSRLELSRPYELGLPPPFEVIAQGPMYPVFLRGLALLRSGNPAESVNEFDKFHQHPGIIQSFPLGSVAQLYRARALAASGNSAAASEAYRALLTQWKNADTDFRLLPEAQREFAKLTKQ
ncbi:MAG: tetratricopeptide repeat protein [Candidatus Korobacteraceae bacterium]|jgi:tetratricopeptide (TPR) repeat protein